MKKLERLWETKTSVIVWLFLAVAGLLWLMLHRLGSITNGGLSLNELTTSRTIVGWHGIYHSPLYLPLKAVQSLVYHFAPSHGASLTRLPNTLFGVLAIIAFASLIWLWHGRRTAIMTTALFATSAWTLHASRLASYDVLYLWAGPSLVLAHVLLQRYGHKLITWYGYLFIVGLLLTIPGLVWLVAAELILNKLAIKKGLQNLKELKHYLLSVIVFLLWSPLIAIDFSQSGQFVSWLGLPQHWPSLLKLLKNLIAVAVHLFIHGPQYPDIWLGKTPVLSAFVLVVCLLGSYFYAVHWRSSRSRSLGVLFIISALLVTISGDVTLSLLVPFTFMLAATGIAYLIHEWLKVFPLNPLARGFGLAIVSLAVAVSCLYNVRAYFVAWPNSPVTKTVFRYHR